ncbi:glutathione s-transferase [Colletotrichum karsti]|uniref:Glutathione s-transferase n=1 Tax=Colletotrichum karsti TaxID=1095194 RepID=A0A9P6LQP9_9PEZI|nr:glutathione s-transferase [Colletotrichum karsti]KAF9881941.1 glutathione s-transferase [Colletotrichum karsti]
MSSSTKPLVLYGYTPNPMKVAMILEELEIPWEMIKIDLAKVKEEAYTSINPNGRLPALKDPNTGITLWESGAIIEYLVDTYDTENKISYASFPEKYLLKQFLHFQMSGQGPYFGQLGWFTLFHPENIQSAKERYEEQTVRVLSVLDAVLKGKKYLVGDKPTYADIAFMPWDYLGRLLLGDAWNDKYDIDSKYPDYTAWAERVKARPVIKNALETMKSERAKESGH